MLPDNSPRTVDIFVRYQSGKSVTGATISFTVNGVAAGEVPYADGRGRIQVPDRTVQIAVTVRLGRQEQTAKLDQSQDSYTFMFGRRWPLVVGAVAAGVAIILFMANRGWLDFGGSARFDVKSRYESQGAHDKSLAIVFVHGIFGSGEGTWLGAAESFPSLLAKDPEFAPSSDVFVFEYFSPYFGSAASITALADQLRGSLEDNRVFENHRAVVFVGHSMGGLVVRKLLLARRDLLEKIPFLYFYATPTNGAELSDVARRISSNAQLRGMIPLQGNDLLQSIQSDWLADGKVRDLPAYCAYETLLTAGVTVVSQASATALCNRNLDPMTANHVEIVKPTDRDDPRYTRLTTPLRKSIEQLLPAPIQPTQDLPPATATPSGLLAIELDTCEGNARGMVYFNGRVRRNGYRGALKVFLAYEDPGGPGTIGRWPSDLPQGEPSALDLPFKFHLSDLGGGWPSLNGYRVLVEPEGGGTVTVRLGACVH